MSKYMQEFRCPDCGRVRMLPTLNGQRQRCPQCALERRKLKQTEYNKRYREKQKLEETQTPPPLKSEAPVAEASARAGSHCRGCVYLNKIDNMRFCEYILVTGMKRPCPAGEGCTVRLARKNTAKSSREDVKRMLRDSSLTDVDIAIKTGISVSLVAAMREDYENVAAEAEH